MNAYWLKKLKHNYNLWVKKGIIDPKAIVCRSRKELSNMDKIVTIFLPIFDPISGEDTETLEHNFTLKEVISDIHAVHAHIQELKSLEENLKSLYNDIEKAAYK